MTSVSASEARTGLPALLDRVEAGEEVAITRHGRVVAVVVRPDALRSRRAAEAMAMAAAVRDRIAEAGARPISLGAGISESQAEELIAEIRADRDAH
jgi:prevent-host-death family protein